MKVLLLMLVLNSALYAKEKDFIIVEGDIAIAKDKSAPNRGKRKWKNGIIPWQISPNDRYKKSLSKAVINGIDLLSKKTNLVFKRKTPKDRDYISFTSRNKGCFSYIGRQSGKQEINLASGCWGKITVAHEIFHASGVEHEQSRQDRDKYINLHLNNVLSSQRHNFNKVKGARYGKYNFNSIMHYGSYAFSNNNRPTMTNKNGKTFSQNRRYLTQGDIDGINSIYPSKYTQFRLEQVKLAVKRLKNGKVLISLKAGPENFKNLNFIQYFFKDNNLDSPKLKNWYNNFGYSFRPKKGKNSILVEFNLRDNKTLEKKFSYFYLDKKITTSCSLNVRNKSKTFTVPLSFRGENKKLRKVSFKRNNATVFSVYDFKRGEVRLGLVLKRDAGIIRKKAEVKEEFYFSKSNSGKVSLKKSNLVCKLKVSSY